MADVCYGKANAESHLVCIPSYNTGSILRQTVEEALEVWPHVWVVIDGSTDDSQKLIEDLIDQHPGFRILELATNSGKGAAIYAALNPAIEAGFTHILTMDADGQHPTSTITSAIELSKHAPKCMVMGQPIFGDDVPLERFYFRKLNNFWTDLETSWVGLGDTLFGMRIYPLSDLLEVMSKTKHARGFDFDPEVAVRLVWLGVRPIKLPISVRYLKANEGGVSHFNYFRDNLKLFYLHLRLAAIWLKGCACKSYQNRNRWKKLHS